MILTGPLGRTAIYRVHLLETKIPSKHSSALDLPSVKLVLAAKNISFPQYLFQPFPSPLDHHNNQDSHPV